MVSADVIVINRLGLHARAAAKLVRIAARFESNIKIHKTDQSIYADAKSILSVLTLAASRGTGLRIDCTGEDEHEALKNVVELFSSGFGED